MFSEAKIIKSILIVGLLLISVAAGAQTVDVEFSWTSTPAFDDQSNPLAPAESYDVFYQRDSGAETLIASVSDTSFVLEADAGVYHRIRVRGVDKEGRPGELSDWSNEVYFDDPERTGGTVPLAGSLQPNYPNPFNPETNIVYGIPRDVEDSAQISLAVYDIQGRLVRTFDIDRSLGWHTVMWDGRDQSGRVMPTGQYLTLFRCGGETTTSKMTMIK